MATIKNGGNQGVHRYRRSGQQALCSMGIQLKVSVRIASLGASIAALTVSTGSLLAPQAASALDFNFSFGGVSGLISGLVDNQADQTCSASPCSVSVVIADGLGSTLGQYTWDTGFFSVSGSTLVASSWQGRSQGGFQLLFAQGDGVLFDSVGVLEFNKVTFTRSDPQQSSVPGPLPLFGAAAAFGFSRKLRNRIKVTRTTAPTAPFV